MESRDEEARRLRARLNELESSTLAASQEAMQGSAVPVRRVSLSLAVGVFFLPVVFAWLLLRRGYSFLARIIGFIWLLVWLVALAGAGTSESGKGTARQPVTAAQDQPRPFNIGEPIDMDRYRLVVTRVSERARVGIPYAMETAADGGVLIAVDFTLENTSSKPLKAFSLAHLILLDAAGTAYQSDLGKTGAYLMETNPDRKLLSDLNPGLRVHDSVVFEVSRAAFDAATWELAVEDARGARIRLTDAPNAPLASGPPASPRDAPPPAPVAASVDVSTSAKSTLPAPAAPPRSDGPPPALQSRWATFDARCRGGSQEEEATIDACDQRGFLEQQLNASGFCRGRTGTTTQWHRC